MPSLWLQILSLGVVVPGGLLGTQRGKCLSAGWLNCEKSRVCPWNTSMPSFPVSNHYSLLPVYPLFKMLHPGRPFEEHPRLYPIGSQTWLVIRVTCASFKSPAALAAHRINYIKTSEGGAWTPASCKSPEMIPLCSQGWEQLGWTSASPGVACESQNLWEYLWKMQTPGPTSPLSTESQGGVWKVCVLTTSPGDSQAHLSLRISSKPFSSPSVSHDMAIFPFLQPH